MANAAAGAKFFFTRPARQVVARRRIPE